MSRDNTAADIAYMRGLAEEGRMAPLLNGPVMVAAALIFGPASLAQWTIQSGLVDVTPWAQLWVWLAAGAAFTVALITLINRLKRKQGAGTVRNQAVGAAWSGVGYMIFTVWLSMMAIGYASGDWSAMRLMPSLVIAAYGAAWLVAAAMSGVKWMNAVAVTCFAGAVLMGLLSNRIELYLAFAGLMALVALLPGLALMRREAARAA